MTKRPNRQGGNDNWTPEDTERVSDEELKTGRGCLGFIIGGLVILAGGFVYLLFRIANG